MTNHRDDTPEFDADADAAPEVVDTSESEFADPPSLPPEADLDIRPTGRGNAGVSTADGDPIDDAPWQQSELPPAQRRRRLIVLAVVAVGFVVGAAVWAFGFGRNLSGNFEAAVNRSEEAEVREATVVVPEEDYVIDIDPVSYTHLRTHETVLELGCRLLLEKKKKTKSSRQRSIQLLMYTKMKM